MKKNQAKEIKRLKEQLKFERSYIEELRSKVNRLEEDRNRYRSFVKEMHDWWVDLLEENKTPAVKYLISRTTTLFSRCTPFL